MTDIKRESFGSRLGFILVSAGCAVGIGNVWKFPYIAGQNGGALFVLFYLIFLVIMGIPVMSMEFAIGRAGQSTCVNAIKKLEKKGSKWHIFGWICLISAYILMFYYTTVAGWMVSYFIKFVNGTFENIDSKDVSVIYDDMLADPVTMMIFTVVIIILGFLVLCFGVRNGLERVSKFMMIGLLMLIMVLAVRSLLLSGAGEGLRFYLVPDLSSVTLKSLSNTMIAAMSQAFFTLSLGQGIMVVFGSFMTRERTITGEAVRITILDTFVAIISGIIIFPACFSYDIAPDSGPSLIFVTLPQVFINMPGGRIWGALFFVFMTFASFSTVTAVFEAIISTLTDSMGWSRIKTILINIPIIIAGSIPCILGFNVLKDIQLINDWDILTTEDFFISKVFMPIGCIVIILFCCLKCGWGYDNFKAENNRGVGLTLPGRIRGYLTFILPLLIIIIFINEILYS